MPALANRAVAAAACVAALAAAQGGGSGPVVLYPLTESAADASGNGRHGSVNGGVTFSPSGALFSPGSSISIPPVLAPALTIRASFQLRSDLPLGAEGWATLFCHDGGTFHHALVEPNSGVLGFYNGRGGYFIGSSFSPQLDTWHNLTAVYNRDGPGSVAMYVNGQWVYRGGGGFDTAVWPLDIIGSASIVSGQYARGWLRNVAVWQYALTDAEIVSPWSMPAPRSSTPTPSQPSITPSGTPTASAPTSSPSVSSTVAPSPGPVALYPLTESAADASGNGRHGSVNGGVTFSPSGALFSPGSSISIPPVLAPALTIRASFQLRSDLPLGAEGWATLFCHDGGTFHHALVEPNSGVLGFYNGRGGYFIGSSFSPQLDTWHNLTAVYNRDGPGSVAMYVNGQWVYRGGGGFDTAAQPLDIIGSASIVSDMPAVGCATWWCGLMRSRTLR